MWEWKSKDGSIIKFNNFITAGELQDVFADNPEKFAKTYYEGFEPHWRFAAEFVEIDYFAYYREGVLLGIVWFTDIEGPLEGAEIHYCLFKNGFRYFNEFAERVMDGVPYKRLIAWFPDTPSYSRSMKFCKMYRFKEYKVMGAWKFSAYENMMVQLRMFVREKQLKKEEKRMEPCNETIENNFRYHKPKDGQNDKYEKLRAKAKELAYMIDHLCPHSREKSLATTKLEESVMWANASIARN